VAVFAGEDGSDGLRSVLDAAAAKLRPGGWLAMEFGYGQESLVSSLVEAAADIELVRIRHDLQDIPRTVICRKHGRE
jgi:release factor glutamine methyltransferase